MHIGEISVRSVIKPVKSRKQYMLKENMNINVLSVIIKLDGNFAVLLTSPFKLCFNVPDGVWWVLKPFTV